MNICLLLRTEEKAAAFLQGGQLLPKQQFCTKGHQISLCFETRIFLKMQVAIVFKTFVYIVYNFNSLSMLLELENNAHEILRKRAKSEQEHYG